MKELLESLKGKVLKNVVLILAVGGKSERLNIKEVLNVGEVAELNVEAIDHRSKDIQVRCFIRVSDIAFITVPNQEV
jgi:2-keto-4-pentenoate hydratase